MSLTGEKFKVVSVWMLMNGDKAIILHFDPISSQIIYYNYVSGKNERCARKVSEDNLFAIGTWDTEWPKEQSYYEDIASVIQPEAHSKILGDRQSFLSNRAIESMVEIVVNPENDSDTSNQEVIWTVQHQEIFKKIEFNRGSNLMKIMRDTYESLALAIDASGAESIVMRIPIEFKIFLDEWTARRYIIVYTRLSLLKNNEQVMLEWGDKREQ